jgi:hypothetical protein
MIAYKQFLTSDIKIIPFEVNKYFYFEGGSFILSDVSIDRFLGKNITGSFNTNSDPTTGYSSTQYQRLIYNSVKELYYSNFLSQSWGDPISQPFTIPGSNPQGDVLVGPSNSSGRYFNYLSSTLTQSRSFPTSSNSEVGVISIPSKLFGQYIQPHSFYYKFVSSSVNYELQDDGEGNLLYNNSVIGNIIYTHGISIITNQNLASSSIAETNVTCSFSSSYTLYETQYKCTIRENEFNYTLNPTTISSSNTISGSWYNFTYPTGSVYNYVTSSFFNPYITTIGLYNDDKELLAVAKLAQPLMTSDVTDLNIIINIDF